MPDAIINTCLMLDFRAEEDIGALNVNRSFLAIYVELLPEKRVAALIE
jgi:hypothetical protein